MKRAQSKIFCLTNDGYACLQGEAGTGNVVEAVRHMRKMTSQIKQIQNMDEDELYAYAKVNI